MVLVGLVEAALEPRLGVAGLQHRHAGNRLRHLGIDVAALLARARHRWRTPALVKPDNDPHRRHQGEHNQHQAPVEPGHGGHGAQHHDAAVKHHKQNLHVKVFHLLGVVGDAAHQLAGDGFVKKCHRQAQHMAVDLFAQALDRAHSHPGEAGELHIPDHTGQAARHQDAAQQQAHRQSVHPLG